METNIDRQSTCAMFAGSWWSFWKMLSDRCRCGCGLVIFFSDEVVAIFSYGGGSFNDLFSYTLMGETISHTPQYHQLQWMRQPHFDGQYNQLQWVRQSYFDGQYKPTLMSGSTILWWAIQPTSMREATILWWVRELHFNGQDNHTWTDCGLVMLYDDIDQCQHLFK